MPGSEQSRAEGPSARGAWQRNLGGVFGGHRAQAGWTEGKGKGFQVSSSWKVETGGLRRVRNGLSGLAGLGRPHSEA